MTVACGLALALALGACGGDEGGTASSGEPASDSKPVDVALFVASLGDGYTRALHESVEAKAKELGATTQTFNANYDPQKQLQQCQDAIVTRKFEAFVVHSVDGPAMTSCARQAVAADIKVVAVGSPIGPDIDTTKPQVEGVTGTILESPSTLGGSLAKLTVDACKGHDPCNVLYEFGPPEFSYAANGRKAFKAEIAKHPGITIVAEGSHRFEPDRARSLSQQLLQAHSDVHVITSDDDPSAAAVVELLKEKGIAERIAVIGGAGSQEAADLIAKGEMFGDAVNVPRSEGEKGAEIAIKAARGEDPGRTEFNNAEDLSPVGPMLTRENVDKFEAQWSAAG
jgi:ABC-type sugar transport system substrate-binding protein